MLNTSQLKILNEQLNKLEIFKNLHGIWKEQGKEVFIQKDIRK